MAEENTRGHGQPWRGALTTARQRRSRAWEHFILIHSTDGNHNNKAQCKSCGKLLNGDPKNGTSHLRRHTDKCKGRDGDATATARVVPRDATICDSEVPRNATTGTLAGGVVPQDATIVVAGVVPQDATTVDVGAVPQDATTVTAGVVPEDATTVVVGVVPQDASTLARGAVPQDAITVVASVVSQDATTVAAGVVPQDASNVVVSVVSQDASTLAGGVVPHDATTVAAGVVPQDASNVAAVPQDATTVAVAAVPQDATNVAADATTVAMSVVPQDATTVDVGAVPQDTTNVAVGVTTVTVGAVPQDAINAPAATVQQDAITVVVGKEVQLVVLVATSTSQPEATCGTTTPQGTECVVKLIKLIKALVAETCTGIIVKFTPADQIKEQQKRCAAYSQKALPFAVTTFFAFVGAHSASSTHTAFFKVAMAAFFLAVPTDLISVTRPPKWGSLLTYLSWFLLVLVSYLLLISFNKDYGYAILPVLPIPVVIALFQLNPWPGAWQRSSRPVQADDVNTEASRALNTDIEAGGQYVNTEDEAVPAANTNNEAGQDVNTEDEVVLGANTSNEANNQYLDSIFNLSAGVVNFGGFVSMISGHYMGGLDKLVGFFFFFTIVLGLYLMMVTTVRTVALTLHARQLSYLLEFLLVSTLITILICKVPDSGSDSHV